MTVRFFEIEELYYSFDYDPITRWKKWTNNYSPVYWIQNRRLSLLGRFLRIGRRGSAERKIHTVLHHAVFAGVAQIPEAAAGAFADGPYGVRGFDIGDDDPGGLLLNGSGSDFLLDIYVKLAVIGQDNGPVHQLAHSACHDHGHDGAVGVNHIDGPLPELLNGLAVEGHAGAVAESLAHVEAGVAQHGIRVFVCDMGIVGRAHEGMPQGILYDVRIVLDAVSHPVDRGRERVIHQADVHAVLQIH